jgi:DNA polymerase-4
MRKIIHVDMDAYYASVEQRDDPSLAGRPVAVGGNPDGRGVVAAASYEARAFGVHSAMAAARARRLCPNLAFVRPRFDVYRAISAEIRAIFLSYTALVEPLALDEAYLDVTGCEQLQGSATLIARQIKQRIFDQTGLTASAGVSSNKLLAKLASAMNKPDGLTVVPPERIAAVMAELPVSKLPGVGPRTGERLKAMGITDCVELARADADLLRARFGRNGLRLKARAAGRDERLVEPDRPAKSIGAETTFDADQLDPQALLERLSPMADKIAQRLSTRALAAYGVTLKLTYADFRKITRSRRFSRPVARADELRAALPGLLEKTQAGRRPVRLVGMQVGSLVSLSSLTEQPDLFTRGVDELPPDGR